MKSTEFTTNERAWAALFKHYNIIQRVKKQGIFEITSKQIKQFREPRLMAYFVHRSSLPKPFTQNNLSILPVARGTYIIGEFDAYKVLEYGERLPAIRKNLPSGIRTIDASNLYSEAVALNCAFIAGIIDDIMGEKASHTLSGRMTTGSFDFCIDTLAGKSAPVSVQNALCEIDAGYEGRKQLLLVEAKNVASRDFLIRQLYYPYRLWRDRISKQVVPAFMTFSNDVFSFFMYEFEEPSRYNSLRLISQRNYTVSAGRISSQEVASLVNQVRPLSEPRVPFPQADSFDRLMDLLGLLMNNEMTADEITANYDFDKRQTDYYTNAGIYLGLIQKRRENTTSIYAISPDGRAIMSKPRREKLLSLSKRILEHEVFRSTMRRRLRKQTPLPLNQITAVMKKSRLYNVGSERTYHRRAQTVSKWVEWIIALANR
jgi:hypothetical protein